MLSVRWLSSILIVTAILITAMLLAPPAPAAIQATQTTYPLQIQHRIVESTAYSHTGCPTFSGAWPRDGRTIAVDTDVIPLQSNVYISGLGWRIAEDKIPKKSVEKGAKVDIFMSCRKDCFTWGRRDIEVIVIPPQR